MISWSPVWALVIRYMRMYRRDPNLLFAIFYWPILDIMTWGFLGTWIASSDAAGFQNYATTALLGVLLWQIVGRGCSILTFAFNEELWSNNIVNLFSLPLRITEWMCGVVLFSVLSMVITLSVCMFFIVALYTIPITFLINTFLLFALPLVFSALWIGFMSLHMVVALGKRGAELGFVLIWFLMPFSGVYYPISVLPPWAQQVSALLPMSYVFEGMRAYVGHQADPAPYLAKGLAMSVVYALCALVSFTCYFNVSKKNGLARLMD